MKLIVAGSREYKFNSKDYDFLTLFCLSNNVTEIVSGGAKGVDYCAIKAGLEIPCIQEIKVFKAGWDLHGRKAGPIRNKQMAEYADALYAFPGGKGTNNMINTMKNLNKPVYYHEEFKKCSLYTPKEIINE